MQGVIAAVDGRVALELAEAQQRAEEIAKDATTIAGERKAEANAALEQAEAEAARIMADATDESRARRRAPRAQTCRGRDGRRQPAEPRGRRRSPAAAPAAAEDRRRAREESLALVAEGRAEADQLRESAQRALERARAEIAQLQTRRDGIAAELGQLSGVIEALSVPERESRRPQQTDPPPHPHAPTPDQETPDA